jgi:NADH-quinone oxidoreductase subunit L
MNLELGILIPWLPALAVLLCGLCCLRADWRRAAGPICVLSIFVGFLISLWLYFTTGAASGDASAIDRTVTFFKWINVGDLQGADFGYYFDALTFVMLFVVCGIGTLVATYAMGYMHGDRGYARFFAFVALFIFSMTNLVMADNLVLLYLGWEGVGLCSYLLIGFFYDKPSAVQAAKKAFIVNRVGDFGFALGIFLAFTTFGTINIPEMLARANEVGGPAHASMAHMWIPFLLMLGAFGKSAQLPLYVWLPDAMEGPTPVSALIHAATMVTAGVYMIARLLPVFELSPYALPVVATIGSVTALFAATIALCQYDLKRIYAYSTISQLGYMFLGVGVLSTVGGVFHLFTHAFFKALLFLTAGSVMHAMAGQLDLRKLSGLRHKMPVTCWLMFIGCLALAGFPLTAGFFSKDLILAGAVEKGLSDTTANTLILWMGILGIFTAFLTAFYTFRLWFRVFMGPEYYEMGEEHHGEDDDHGDHDAHAHHGPHEMPWWPMNAPLAVLAIGSLFAGLFGLYGGESHGWMGEMIHHSSADATAAGVAGHGGEAAAHGQKHGGEHAGPTLLGMPLHTGMQVLSGFLAIAGIALAGYFHWLDRKAADKVAAATKPVVTVLANKYYVDELYDLVIVRPLRGMGHAFFIIDQLIINAIVYAIGWLPVLVGRGAQPVQSGRLQGYGLGMALGLGVVVLLVFSGIKLWP